MKPRIALLTTTLLLALTGIANASEFKDQLRQTLKENPEILFEVIQENPLEFMNVLQVAVKQAEQRQEEAAKLREQQELEAAFKTPFKPHIREDEAIRGDRNAPLVLVEYSDFECPFCQRGYNTVMELMKRYEGKVQFVYKHLPLSFHRNARPASVYYEALRLQSNRLAFAFHDEIFKDINKLKQGEGYLKQVCEKIGADMALLEKTLVERKGEIDARIEADMAEAAKFGMQGTPGFLLNGIPVRGAYPSSHFEKIISELQKRNMVKL